MFYLNDDGDPTLGNPRLELLMQCHLASRLLMRLQSHLGPEARPGMPFSGMPMPPLPFDGGRPSPPAPFMAMRGSFGTMFGQGRLLYLLKDSDGMMIKDLVNALDIRPSSASELVSKLEKQGLVRVEGDDSDKRVRKVFLTDEGRQVAERIDFPAQNLADELLGALSEDEQAQLLELLKKLNDSLRDKDTEYAKEAADRLRTRSHEGRGHQRGDEGRGRQRGDEGRGRQRGDDARRGGGVGFGPR